MEGLAIERNGGIAAETEEERTQLQALRDIVALNGPERRTSLAVEVIGPAVDELTEIMDRQVVEGIPDDTPYFNGRLIPQEDGEATAWIATDPDKPDEREEKRVKSVGQRKLEIALNVEKLGATMPDEIWEAVKEAVFERPAVEKNANPT